MSVQAVYLWNYTLATSYVQLQLTKIKSYCTEVFWVERKRCNFKILFRFQISNIVISQNVHDPFKLSYHRFPEFSQNYPISSQQIVLYQASKAVLCLTYNWQCNMSIKNLGLPNQKGRKRIISNVTTINLLAYSKSSVANKRVETLLETLHLDFRTKDKVCFIIHLKRIAFVGFTASEMAVPQFVSI